MDYPPNDNYEVVLNGVVVGSVKATGSLEVDKHTIMEFLKEKGLYKKVTEVKAMCRQAVSFSTTAAYLHEKGLMRSPFDLPLIAPFVVNSAFSIELYLKTLLKIFGNFTKGHDPLALYRALPKTATDAIAPFIDRSHNKWIPGEKTDFESCIIDVSNAFVDWRYLYEKQQSSSIRIPRMIFILNMLHDTCGSLPAIKD